MKETVFLFGAGASAKALPINNALTDRIKNLAQNLRQQLSPLNSEHSTSHPELEDLLNTLIDDLEWVYEISKKYNTVDTWAKELTFNNNISDLNRLKIALITFFELEPRTRYLNDKPDLDSRYLKFFNDIWPEVSGDIKKPIKIISWNYDTQLELGRARYIDYAVNFTEEYCLDSNLYALQVVSKNTDMPQYDLHQKPFSCYLLNGIACMTRNKKPNAIDNNGLGQDLTKDNLPIFLLEYKGARNVTKEQMPAISYAWEADTNLGNNVLKLAQEAVKGAEVLVIIGYSFPDGENTKVDEKILSSMQSLEVIYIQDLYPDSVTERLQNFYNGPAKIIPVPMGKDDGFYIPQELKQ